VPPVAGEVPDEREFPAVGPLSVGPDLEPLVLPAVEVVLREEGGTVVMAVLRVMAVIRSGGLPGELAGLRLAPEVELAARGQDLPVRTDTHRWVHRVERAMA